MIVQLPDKYNTTNDIYELIKEKCISTCPMCGENKHMIEYLGDGENNKGIYCWGQQTWYGKRHEYKHGLFWMGNPFKRKHHWRIDSCSCLSCGCKWITPPYPTDSITPMEYAKILEFIKKELE